jgi:hypothetical protein
MRWLPKFFPPILVALVLALGVASPSQIETPAIKSEGSRDNPASKPIAPPVERPHTEKPSDKGGGTTNNYYCETPQSEMSFIAPVVNLALTFFLVLFTGGLVYVGRQQAKWLGMQSEWMGKQTEWMGKTNEIYQAQRELQRQQMLLTHRPLIRVRDITFAKELVVNEPIEVCFEFINVGASTAKIISSNVTVKIGPVNEVPWRMFSRIPQPYDGEVHTLEDWIREHHPDDPAPTLAAGLTLNMTKAAHLALHPGQRADLLDGGSLAVWAMGFVYYQDGTGQHRKMGFCYQAKKGFDFRFFSANDPDLSYEE